MAEFQVLWTRQEEPDPRDPDFVHILEVGIGDALGNYLGAWPVAEVIKRIKAGDRFMVAAVLWDQVQVRRREVVMDGRRVVREFIQTAGNNRDITNLKIRHQHGPRPTRSTVR